MDDRYGPDTSKFVNYCTATTSEFLNFTSPSGTLVPISLEQLLEYSPGEDSDEAETAPENRDRADETEPVTEFE